MNFISIWLKNKITSWLWECIWPNVELGLKQYVEKNIETHKSFMEENIAFMREARESGRDDHKYAERRHAELIETLKLIAGKHT